MQRQPRVPEGIGLAYAEMFGPRSFDLTTFADDEHYDELVLARSIPVHPVCEHHMLGTLREDPRSRAGFLALTTSDPTTPAGGRHG